MKKLLLIVLTLISTFFLIHTKIDAQEQTNLPSISITNLKNGETITSLPTTLNVDIQNWKIKPILRDANGNVVPQKDVVGEGHWHLYINGQFKGHQDHTSIQLLSSYFPTPGTYEIRGTLANNDHSLHIPLATNAVIINYIKPSPFLEITYPTQNSIIYSTSLTLTLKTQNFNLVPNPINPNQGTAAIFLGNKQIATATSNTVTLNDIPSGKQVIQVKLLDYNGKLLSPSISWTNTYTFDSARPSIKIISPLPETYLNNTPSTLSLQVAGFIPASAQILQKVNTPKTGYWNIYLDNTFLGSFTINKISIPALSQGQHTIKAVLYNNDQTPLIPATQDSIEVSGGLSPQSGSIFSGPTMELLGLLIVLLILAAILVVYRKYHMPKANTEAASTMDTTPKV